MDTIELNKLIAETNQGWDAFYAEAFRGQSTPEPLKKLSRRICESYGIRGICDPQYIANIIALELGMGDGQGNFNAHSL